MSLASMIAKQVVKATGDMFQDTDIQKAISAQVDEVVSANNLDSKEGQDYLLRMTKAMVTDDPNFKVDRNLDPNLGMYLEVENKLFSGNPGVRNAYHAAKINNAKLGGSSEGGKSTYMPAYKSEIGRTMGKKELVSDLEKIGIEYDYDLSTFDIQDFEGISVSGKRLIKALEKEDFLGYDNLDQLLSDIFESGIENYEPSSSLQQAFGRYLNEISMSDLAEPAKIKRTGRTLKRSKGKPLSDDTLKPYAEVPKPATYDEMFLALAKNKKQKINLDIPEGLRVGLRLDISAYTNYDTWVPTIHVKGKSSHRATASIRNVDLMPSPAEEKKAEAVMMGGAKSPFAKISGNLINRTDEENYRLAQEALNDPSWTQVGFNPDRHSYYFDRATGDPIIAGDEAIQVGPLVLVKNAVRGERKDFAYSKGGITRRFAVAKGGKIDKKKMACNKPRRTPGHPKKSHVVKACEGGKEKIIRFGEQGAKTAGKPKSGESARMKAKRKSFKARHAKNIKRGKMSAAYWADKVKW